MHANILKKVGADRVVMAESETGIRLGKSLISGGFQDFFMLSDWFSMVELPVPEAWTGHNLEGAGSAEEIQYQRNRRQGRGRHPCQWSIRKTLLRAEEALTSDGETKNLPN